MTKIVTLLFQHIDKLDRRSQKVVKMRFGLDGYQEYTYMDLAKQKVSRERARQIELKAIRKLSDDDVITKQPGKDLRLDLEDEQLELGNILDED